MSKSSKQDDSTIVSNKKATHDYFLEDKFEAGIALLGTAFTLVVLILGKPFEKFLHRKFPKLTEHSHDEMPPRG